MVFSCLKTRPRGAAAPRKAGFLAASLLVLAACLAGGCGGPHRAPELGEAYAGPATLKLRRDIDPHSPAVATVAHGDRLGIVGRRRFVRVRTASGIEGWTDLRQLLGAAQMDQLNRLAEASRQLPSQGAATVYEAVNVHTEPNRQAPSFYRVIEGELVDVVAHQMGPRVPFETGNILPPPAPRPAKPSPKPKEETRTARPPQPPPVRPPDDWLELSKTTAPADEDKPDADEAEPAKPPLIDDWALVRLKNGRAGWVLTGSLKMNIPDEVAQYSEGRRITSYFATAGVNDGGQIKYNWLWTTIGDPRQPCEFDGFRYFVWSVRHHRYETAHVESNLKGFYPVEVHPVQATMNGKAATYPGFSLIVEENGVRYRKTYAYQVYLVRLVGKERIETPPEGQGLLRAMAQARTAAPSAQPAATPAPGLFARLKGSISALRARWFGKK